MESVAEDLVDATDSCRRANVKEEEKGPVMQIRKISLYDTRLPLKVPYASAIATLDCFSSLFARIENEEGIVGVGECSAVSGYSPETPAQAWAFAQKAAQQIVGKCAHFAREWLAAFHSRFPFTNTAFLCALEELESGSLLQPLPEAARFPLVGIVNPGKGEPLPAHVEQRLAEKYTTLKVKVGKHVGEDIEKVRLIQAAVAGRAKIRLDANQGYCYADALKFVNAIDPAGVELFEQPFAPAAWADMARLSKVSPLPLMLDESIYGMEEIQLAAEHSCADYLKFKLMKSSSGAAMRKEIASAQSNGMAVIVGNGIASDLGCFQETVVAIRCGVSTAGEQNGFLKPIESILENPLTFRDGYINLPAGYRPRLDWDVVEKYTVNSFVIEA